jgi:hypothetical protein
VNGAVRVQGVIGQVRWSYYIAAAVHGYAVMHDEKTDTWSLKANIVNHDSFKLSQRPLAFVALHANGSWRWPIRDFNIHQGVMTARLGPME